MAKFPKFIKFMALHSLYEGVFPKSTVCPSKPRENKHFVGFFFFFAGISRLRRKSLRDKKFVLKSCPLYFRNLHIYIYITFPVLRSERYHNIKGFGELFGNYSARMVGPLLALWLLFITTDESHTSLQAEDTPCQLQQGSVQCWMCFHSWICLQSGVGSW